MKDISRRTLVRAGALGVVLIPITTGRSALAAAVTNLYGRTRFTPLVGKTFTLSGADTSTTATLAQVSDLAGAARNDNDRYCLTFRTATAGPPQGSYTLRRAGFTATTLFVVPSDATSRTYQAIVNRGT